ncbi:MAG: M23 family metallopeptidase, partial [Candidatus Thorarchaeota archaeon]
NDCGRDTPHQGIDLGTDIRTPIFAPFDGVVKNVGCHIIPQSNAPTGWGLGERITIESEDGLLRATFGHLLFTEKSLNRSVHVKAGEKLGETGSTMGCFSLITDRKEGLVDKCEAKCKTYLDEELKNKAITSEKHTVLLDQCHDYTCGIPGGVAPHLHFELREKNEKSFIVVNPKEALISTGDMFQ